MRWRQGSRGIEAAHTDGSCLRRGVLSEVPGSVIAIAEAAKVRERFRLGVMLQLTKTADSGRLQAR
jgi:hypothetical protein